MKKILIIEDEHLAAKRLRKLIQNLDEQVETLAVIDSIEDTVAWFQNYPEPDLAFFDIQLADGQSFAIFEQVKINCPIIFTTAYDQYALQAFKVNSIDYLLKPIEPKELERAWQKFNSLQNTPSNNISELATSFKQLNQTKNYKERLLIKSGDTYQYLTIDQVAYFYSEDGLSFLMSNSGKRFVIDDKLEALAKRLNPRNFFRINRKFIINEKAISKISTYFNSRLKLELHPPREDVIVARERVSEFKLWLNG